MSHPVTDDDSASTVARIWSPYEKTQLLRHNISLASLDTTEAPVEYITGHVDFAGYDFLVTADTLIPRIETEELIEIAWKQLQEMPKPWNVLDLGTGCGAIAITLANKCLAAQIPTTFLATDISAPALVIAQQNHKKIAPTAQISFLASDLLDSVPSTQRFSIISANLPYIPSERIAYLESSVKDYEPWVALDGGPEGLTLIDRLLTTASKHLVANGKIILEVDYTHTTESFAKHMQDWKISSIFDSLNRNRFIIAQKK